MSPLGSPARAAGLNAAIRGLHDELKSLVLVHRRKYRSQSRLTQLCAILCLIILSAPNLNATSVVVIRLSDGFVIGTDSKISYVGSAVQAGVICKIHQAKHFVWVSEGYYAGEGHEFNLPRLVGAVDVEGALTDRMKAFVASGREPLRRELEVVRRENPSHFDLMLKRKHSFEIAFIRMEEVPKWSSLTFQLGVTKAGRIVSTPIFYECPGENCPAGMSMLMMGNRDAMDAWIRDYNKGAHPQPDAGTMAATLINLEIANDPEHDGPPVQILVVTKQGFQWISSGPCAGTSLARP
jgi:hypothetical protein